MEFVKIALIFTFAFLVHTISAQSSFIKFSVTYGSKTLTIDDSLPTIYDSTQLQISGLKFYISKIQFLKNKKVIYTGKNSFHLIDASNASTQKITFVDTETIVVDEITFYLGIDSLTNVSGAMGGDLDPAKGMYWTWQSGYINIKLEGNSKLCKTRNNEFQFHLGGYQAPFYCLQTLQFPIKNKNEINIKIDLEKIISQLNLTKQNHIMSPNKEAFILSKVVANAFSILDK
jgi:hypothetical protein